jgi:hypothetical protein
VSNARWQPTNPTSGEKASETKDRPATGQAGPTPDLKPESTANWPGLPGGTQPKDRSNGVQKIKEHVRSEGV